MTQHLSITQKQQMDIKADVKSIIKLKDYFFIVPDYQREYVWKADEQVARFLQDISDEFKPGAATQSNYFIGSTIIVERGGNSYDVVDGQQRLTTIILALCAIRKALVDFKSVDVGLLNLRDELQKEIRELLYKFDISTRKQTPRLELQYLESKGYLDYMITGNPFTDKETPSIRRMREAYESVLDFLWEEDEEAGAELLEFVSYFLTNVQMVIIKPDDLGSALKIFETINERGVGLNAMDLLKNLLFIHAREDEFKIIKDTWWEMTKYLDASKEGDKPLRFLRYFLMARYHNGIIREDEIYTWMTSLDGIAKIGYKANPIRFIKELRSAAEKYAKFIRATMSDKADVTYPNITGIGYLSKKTSRQHLVLLSALPDNAPDEVVNLLAKNIESLVFYYAVNRTLTKSYEPKFANWAQKLRTITTKPNLELFLNDEFSKELTEQQNRFMGNFATKNQSELNPQYRIKYILGKVDEYIREKVHMPSADFSFYQGQQLEHILPQTGMNIPNALYPEPYDYTNTVQKFGNLTLLEAPINQSLNNTNDLSSDLWFETKKKAYLNSSIILTRTFSDIKIGEQTAFNGFATKHLKTFNSWTMKEVAERQDIIKNLMTDIWKIYN